MDKSLHCFVCSRAAGTSQGSQAGYEQMEAERNQIPASFILHPSLPLPCPSCCQLGERSFVPWPSPAPHEKPSIKPRALQPLLPFQSLFFLLPRIWRDGRSVQSPELIVKSKAGRAKGVCFIRRSREFPAWESVRATPPCKSGHLFSKGKKAFLRFRALGQKSKSI